MTRREAIAATVGFAATGGAVSFSSRKEIVSKNEVLLIFEMPERRIDRDDDQIARIEKQLTEKLPGRKVVVVPHGVKVTAVPTTVYFQREKLGTYEYEVHAKTKEELVELLSKIGAGFLS